MEKSYVKTPAEIAHIENEALQLFWERNGIDKHFHHRNGIWFVRKGVIVKIMKIHFRQETTSIEYHVNNCEVRVDFEHEIDSHSWASIISSLSKGGETQESFQKILEFHG